MTTDQAADIRYAAGVRAEEARYNKRQEYVVVPIRIADNKRLNGETVIINAMNECAASEKVRDDFRKRGCVPSLGVPVGDMIGAIAYINSLQGE